MVLRGLKERLLVSSTEGIFFASYNDTNDIEAMIINETWLVPEPSEYFI